MSETDRAIIDQAKGALMLRYGIGSHLALASLMRWSHEANAPLHALAHTLVDNVENGDKTALRDPALVQWLEERLRNNVPDVSIPAQRRPPNEP